MNQNGKEGKLPDGMSLSVDARSTAIMYTDSVFMTINDDGVVLDVAQRIGTTNQAQIVARVGMSRIHAEKFVKKLQDLLLMNAGKLQTNKKLN